MTGSMTSGDRRLAETFIALADTMVRDFDVSEFLHMLGERSIELFGAEQAGVILADPNDGLVAAASTDHSTASLEVLELDLGSGPCVDSFQAGETVYVDDLSDSEPSRRWPQFTDSALSLGLRSTAAVPMQLRDETIGALDLFSGEPRAMSEADLRWAESLADVATIGILHAKALSHAHEVTEQLQTALDSRVVIEQAKGMVAQDLGVDGDEAFRIMRRYARDTNGKLRDIAALLTRRALSPSELGEPGPRKISGR